MARSNTNRRDGVVSVASIPGSPIARTLFTDPRAAWLWLAVRLYAGYEWVTSGLEKIGSPAWTGSHAGTALNGFIGGALKKTTGEHPDVTVWYASFLHGVVQPNAAPFSHVVAYGEFLVGVALILGAFTGVAAFFGAFMNLNYLLAGAVSANPFLLVSAAGLMLAWRVAGLVGLDRWLLPALGAPWAPGRLVSEDAPVWAVDRNGEVVEFPTPLYRRRRVERAGEERAS